LASPAEFAFHRGVGGLALPGQLAQERLPKSQSIFTGRSKRSSARRVPSTLIQGSSRNTAPFSWAATSA